MNNSLVFCLVLLSLIVFNSYFQNLLAQLREEPSPEINGNMYVYADFKRVGELLEPIPERTSISFDNPVSGIRFERMMNGHSDIHISFSAHAFIPVTETKELVKYFHVAIGVEEIERLTDRTIYSGTGNIAFDHDRYHEVSGRLEVSADGQTATFIAEPLLTPLSTNLMLYNS